MPWSMRVRGRHGVKPQTPGVPPPHVVIGVQTPQSSAAPQPSPAGPHWIPWSMQVRGRPATRRTRRAYRRRRG
ncbi:MAG: hypothetical protein U0325_00365 [Polyangiales bacterium]